jgi:hypothetical protein
MRNNTIDKTQPILVWDCTFYIESEDGTIKMYKAPNLDFSHIAEYVDYEDLELIISDEKATTK